MKKTIKKLFKGTNMSVEEVRVELETILKGLEDTKSEQLFIVPYFYNREKKIRDIISSLDLTKLDEIMIEKVEYDFNGKVLETAYTILQNYRQVFLFSLIKEKELDNCVSTDLKTVIYTSFPVGKYESTEKDLLCDFILDDFGSIGTTTRLEIDVISDMTNYLISIVPDYIHSEMKDFFKTPFSAYEYENLKDLIKSYVDTRVAPFVEVEIKNNVVSIGFMNKKICSFAFECTYKVIAM